MKKKNGHNKTTISYKAMMSSKKLDTFFEEEETEEE